MAEQPEATRGEGGISRRTFLRGASGGLLAGLAVDQLASAGAPAAEPPAAAALRAETLAGPTEIVLTINGQPRRVTVEPDVSLLSALRHRLEPPLTGSKEVCAMGNCGACTVLLDDRPVYACLQLAVECVGREIRTVEGLGSPEALSPVQQAFCEHDALMCGFCTPGFVVAGTACLEKHGDPDEQTIRHELSGNLCRCGTYTHVFDALRTAAARRGGRKGR